MEPQVGLVSGKLEEKEYGYKPGSRVYAGPNWGWQTQESYQKTIEMRGGAAFFNFMSSLGEPVKQFLAPVAEKLAPVAEAVSGVVQATPLVGPFTEALGTTTETLRQEAVQRGLDPRFGDVAVMAGEELVTAGLGKAVRAVDKVLPPPGSGPQLALATAAPTPMPPSMSVTPSFEKGGLVMKAVTITDPETLRVTGRQTGEDALSPEQAKQQTKRILDIQKAENALAQAEDELATLADIHGRKPAKEENPRVYRQFQNALGAKGRAQTDLSRAQSNVLVPTEDNPLWYKTTKALFVKKQEQLRRGLTQALEQHHKFPKGLSGAYFSRMDELIDAGLAEPDDLFVMAEYARKRGVEAGDVRSNLANQVKKPHTELHKYMRNTGEEMSKTKWKQVVKEAKNVDELMVLWRDIIDNNVIPNYKLAEVWQPLDDLVREIQGIK
jgi:hypothetical protein